MSERSTENDVRLRALAEAATPGPWRWSLTGTELRAPGPHNGFLLVDCFATGTWGPDATYLAAVSPDVVLGLLDRLAEAWNEGWKASGRFRSGDDGARVNPHDGSAMGYADSPNFPPAQPGGDA